MKKNNHKVIERMAKAAEQGGGLTVESGQTVTHSTGYQVSTDKASERIFQNPKAALMAAFREQGPMFDAGLWKGPQGWYLDTSSQHFHDLHEALLIAYKARQEGILRWSDMKTITFEKAVFFVPYDPDDGLPKGTFDSTARLASFLGCSTTQAWRITHGLSEHSHFNVYVCFDDAFLDIE